MTAYALVLDDEAPMRAVLRELLEDAGWEVGEAATCREAMASIARRRPDVLVSDIFLKGPSGIELIGALRQAGQSFRVVAMSGGGSIGGRDVLEAARIAGADAVLRKPFDPASLARAVGDPQALQVVG